MEACRRATPSADFPLGHSRSLCHLEHMGFRLIRPFAVLALPFMLGGALPSPTADDLRDLPGWLAGTWAMQDGSAWAEEVWTDPRDGMMLGLGREGFGGQVQTWEVVRIQRRPGGGIAYIAQPRGGQSVEFVQTVASDQAVEFTNPMHHFPQRIRYWREGQLLMAEISKMDGSEAVRWNYRPVAAPSVQEAPEP